MQENRSNEVVVDLDESDPLSLIVADSQNGHDTHYPGNTSDLLNTSASTITTVTIVESGTKPNTQETAPEEALANLFQHLQSQTHSEAVHIGPAFPDSQPNSTYTSLSEILPNRPHSGQSLPTKFENYHLVWEVRKDALSTSYLAKRDGIEQLLVVRIFNSRLTDKIVVRNLQKSANKASEITHINHLTVYETGIAEDGSPFVVTEWIESESLRELFTVAKRLDIGRFLNIFNQVGEALIEIHSQQLIHANLSPEKILLAANEADADIVKLIDVGMPIDPIQNAFYLSPEQRLDSNKVDSSTDIYSLGCIMFEALVGVPPYVGHEISKTGLNYLHELANQYAPSSPEHNALRLLDCIIIKCLQKKPSKRFRNMRDLMDALRIVSACIVGGSTKKLPPKAEKLLLFRFLDLFDKKIFVILSSWLLLSAASVKFIGEMQLQKFIDQAQLERMHGDSMELFYWNGAINQAASINKPASLQAELHWNLGDAYRRRMYESVYAKNNDLAIDAIKQYEIALRYYDHGSYYKSYAIQLLDLISALWMSMDTEDEKRAKTESTINQASKLLHKHQYSECAAMLEKYLEQHADDAEIFALLHKCYVEMAKTSPHKPRLLERASYYQDSETPDESDYYFVTSQEPQLASSALDRTNISSCTALLEGDLPAYLVETARQPYAGLLRETVIDYLSLRNSPDFDAEKNRYTQKAIQSLKESLRIEEQVYGKHSILLEETLSNLAKCYRIDGQTQKAIDTYAKFFALTFGRNDIRDGLPGTAINHDQVLLAYVNLLNSSGKTEEARRILEKKVLRQGRFESLRNPLNIRLILLYSQDKSKRHRAKQLLSDYQTTLRTPKLVGYGTIEGGNSSGDPFDSGMASEDQSD